MTFEVYVHVPFCLCHAVKRTVRRTVRRHGERDSSSATATEAERV